MFKKTTPTKAALLAALALSSISSSAYAAIVCGPIANLPIPANLDGVYINLVTGATGTAGGSTAGWDINAFQTGTPAALFFFWPTTPANSFGGVATGNVYDVLAANAPIGPAQNFSVASGGGGNAPYVNVHAANGDNLFGVRFFNEGTAAINFGWMRLNTTSPTGFPATLVQYCYQNDGSQILAGDTGVVGGNVAPVVSLAATTLTAGTGSVTPTITTPAQGTGSTNLACSIPPTAPSNFAITSNATQTVTTTTAAIGLTCVPQAAITTATLTCTQTATPGPNPANATALITCPAIAPASQACTVTASGATYAIPAASHYDASQTSNFTGVGTGDYLFEDGWWFRVAGDTQESFFPAPNTTNCAGAAGTITWTDVSSRGLFSATNTLALTSSGANTGELTLTMSITNLSAVNPLTISLFHGADFDVNGSAATDNATLLTPNNRIRITDTTAGLAEYGGLNPSANAFLVRPFAAATDVFGVLGNVAVDNFDNTTLPSTNFDFTGGFQWNLVIPPSGTSSVTAVLTGNAALPVADVAPTLTYTPDTAAGVTFPSGPAGTANASIGIASAGAVGAGQTAVTGCAITGAGAASFGAVNTTPANGIFNTATTTGSIDLTCTRGLTVANASLSCTETATPGVAVTRTWALTCPEITPVAPVAAVAATTLTAGVGSVTPTITTPAQGSGSTQFACSIPASAPSNFTITSNASQTITTTTAAIGLTCVQQAAITTATLTCTQTATPGPNPADATALITCPALPNADLSITKTDGQTSSVPGSAVTYTIVASNAGPDAATATVGDVFPATLTGSKTWTCVGAGGGTCTAAGTGNINDPVNLPNGASVTYTVTATIAASATGSLANTATVTIGGGVIDPNPGNNSATDSNTLTPQADLRLISLVPSATQTNVNTPVTFTATSQNFGPSDAQNVVVSIVLSPDFRFTSLTATGATCTTPQVGNSGTITCTWAGATAPNATRVLAVTAFSNNQALNNVSASTSSSTPDPVANNNAGAATVTVGLVIQGIPTLNSLSMLLLGLLLALGGLAAVRRHS